MPARPQPRRQAVAQPVLAQTTGTRPGLGAAPPSESQGPARWRVKVKRFKAKKLKKTHTHTYPKAGKPSWVLKQGDFIHFKFAKYLLKSVCFSLKPLASNPPPKKKEKTKTKTEGPLGFCRPRSWAEAEVIRLTHQVCKALSRGHRPPCDQGPWLGGHGTEERAGHRARLLLAVQGPPCPLPPG